jgi:hypothetical protein
MYAIYYKNTKIFENDNYNDCAALAEIWGIIEGHECDLIDMSTGEILMSYCDGECTWCA